MSSDVTLLELAAKIVAAHVTRNSVPAEGLPDVIRTVYGALRSAQGAAPAVPEPAVPVRKSIFPDYIICLEDGKQLKSLKRHLATVYNLTPEEYRSKWNLPEDYPMVAPNYAARRSFLAKEMGLGKQPRARKSA